MHYATNVKAIKVNTVRESKNNIISIKCKNSKSIVATKNITVNVDEKQLQIKGSSILNIKGNKYKVVGSRADSTCKWDVIKGANFIDSASLEIIKVKNSTKYGNKKELFLIPNRRYTLKKKITIQVTCQNVSVTKQLTTE